MQLRATLIVAERARPVVARELAACSLGAGEDRAMVYLSDARNADGTPLEGFIPGYTVIPWALKEIENRWVRVEGQDIPHFFLDPLVKWNVEKGFALDILRPGSSRFSIEPL